MLEGLEDMLHRSFRAPAFVSQPKCRSDWPGETLGGCGTPQGFPILLLCTSSLNYLTSVEDHVTAVFMAKGGHHVRIYRVQPISKQSQRTRG